MTKQNVFNTVKQVLIEKPEARDNDMFLTATIWYRDLINRKSVGDLTLVGFFHIMRDYKSWGLVSFETISRLRRLVQETCPELRGKEYENRRRKRKEVKKDIESMKAEAVFGNSTTFTPQEPYENTPKAQSGGQLSML